MFLAIELSGIVSDLGGICICKLLRILEIEIVIFQQGLVTVMVRAPKRPHLSQATCRGELSDLITDVGNSEETLAGSGRVGSSPMERLVEGKDRLIVHDAAKSIVNMVSQKAVSREALSENARSAGLVGCVLRES